MVSYPREEDGRQEASVGVLGTESYRAKDGIMQLRFYRPERIQVDPWRRFNRILSEHHPLAWSIVEDMIRRGLRCN
jgi:hypothetical protein